MTASDRLPPLGPDPDVAVVVPARAAADALPLAIASVVAQRHPVREIAVAVDPDDDATSAAAAALAEADPRVRVVANPGGSTPAGLNRALTATASEVVARLDAHAWLPPDYVRIAVETLRRTGAANVGGRQLAVADDRFGAAVARAMATRLGSGGATYRVGRQAGPADTVYLGVFRRPALEAVGGYDERLLRNQDFELNHRLRARGFEVWFDPALEARYRPRSSVRALARQYFEYGRFKRHVITRMPSSLRARQLAPPALVVLLAAGGAMSVAHRRWWPVAAPACAWIGAVATEVASLRVGARATVDTVAATLVMHLSWGLGFLLGRSVDARPGRVRLPVPGGGGSAS